MLFLLHLIIAIFCLSAIIYSCSLFTNAIEHLGNRLRFGANAIGSILAVIGTTLPETIVPLVAIFSAIILKTDLNNASNIATGAIIGSPFMLTTLALFLLGIVLIFKKRNSLNIDTKNISRDYKYFIITYATALFASFLPTKKLQILSVLFLLILYIIFVVRTIKKSRKNFETEELEELIFFKFFKKNLIFSQILVSLIALVLFSHFFIDEIEYFSTLFKINPLLLSLFITPFATELPECVNSILWLKKDKDELAIANVLGAIVFQAAIPMSIGILLTPWKFDCNILVNIGFVLACCAFFTGSIFVNKKITVFPLILCGAFYFGYLIFVLVRNFNIF